MAHIDYVKSLVDAMGDREFTTGEIADLMIDYWEDNRVHCDRTVRITKAYSFLKTLAKWGFVTRTRIDYSPATKLKVAYWKRIE